MIQGSVKSTFGVKLLDFLLFILMVLWLTGGVSIGGKPHLHYGLDLLRGIIALTLLGFLWVPTFRESSIFYRLLARLWHALLEANNRRILLFSSSGLGALALVLKTRALEVTLYDTGIFHQILWSLNQGLGFHSTVSGAGNFLLDHLSPSLALLAPLFHLAVGSPHFLPLVSLTLLFVGIRGWIYFGETMPDATPDFRAELARGAAVVGVCFSSLWANLWWGFHENNLAFAAMSWGFPLLIQGVFSSKPKLSRVIWSIPFFLITALSKEILLVTIAFLFFTITLFLFLKLKTPSARLLGIFLVLLAAIFLGLFFWFESIPHPSDKNYFARYYSYLGLSQKDFFMGLLQSPFKILDTIGVLELIQYSFQLMLPWLFLPLWLGVLALKKGERLSPFWLSLALLPNIAAMALSTHAPLRSASFHYVLEVWPLFACLTLWSLSMLQKKSLIMGWVVINLLLFGQDPIHKIHEMRDEALSNHEAFSLMGKIPPDDSVMADDWAGPLVSGRELVSRYPDFQFFTGVCPTWIILRDRAELSLAGTPCQNQSYLRQWQSGRWSAFRRVEKD